MFLFIFLFLNLHNGGFLFFIFEFPHLQGEGVKINSVGFDPLLGLVLFGRFGIKFLIGNFDAIAEAFQIGDGSFGALAVEGAADCFQQFYGEGVGVGVCFFGKIGVLHGLGVWD